MDLSKAGHLPLRGWALCNWLKAWVEKKKTYFPLSKREFSSCLPLDFIYTISCSCPLIFKLEHRFFLGLPRHWLTLHIVDFSSSHHRGSQFLMMNNPSPLSREWGCPRLLLVSCFLPLFYTICLFIHLCFKGLVVYPLTDSCTVGISICSGTASTGAEALVLHKHPVWIYYRAPC